MPTQRTDHEPIYTQLLKAGCELDHHESDLYCAVSDTSRKIIDGYESKSNVTTFRSQIDRAEWYDIPFAYLPFWDKSNLQGWHTYPVRPLDNGGLNEDMPTIIKILGSPMYEWKQERGQHYIRRAQS